MADFDDLEHKPSLLVRLSEEHCLGDPSRLLDFHEKQWLAFASVLELHGYRFGGRLAPGWIPFRWKDPNLFALSQADWMNFNAS